MLAISALSIAAAVIAMGIAFSATLAFFGETPTDREESIAAHAARTFLWAVLTPVCAWAVLRGGRRAWAAAIGWLGLFGLCAWWWWPGPPTDIGDTERQVWHTPYGSVLWLLTAASIGVWVRAAHGRDDRRGVVVGLVVAVAIAAAGVWSHLELDERQEDLGAIPDGSGHADGCLATTCVPGAS